MKAAVRSGLGVVGIGLLGLAAPTAAQGPDFPARRPGLWEITTVTEKPDGVPKISARICVDAATDRDLMEFGLRFSRDACKRYDVSRSGTGWIIETQCVLGAVTSTSRAQVSGDFNARVRVRMEGTAEGLPGTNGPERTLLTQDARWVAAACGEGMSPGDVAVDGGIKVNIKQLKQLQKLLPGLKIR